jgi:hypothetical protein
MHTASRFTVRTLPDIVQEIGAAAGLVAVVGLAVLSALYFSQARDVKRLREWAGRAPERSRPGATAVPRRAAVVPVPAAGTATKAASPQREGTEAEATGMKPDAKPTPELAGAQPGGAAAPSGVPASHTRPRPGTPASGSEPPPVARQPFRRIGTRDVTLALVGVLVLGGVAAYGVTRLTGDDGGGNSRDGQRNNHNGSPNKPKRNGAAIKPGNVTVAVLNGTTVPGLAASLRDQIAAAGFKKGAINVFSDQQLAESLVEYAPGHQAEAEAVSRIVAITQRELITANSRALAGDATVIVIAGADKAP